MFYSSESGRSRAIREGSDLRFCTEFRVNELLNPNSRDRRLIFEVSDRLVTYLIDDSWALGIVTLRQPVLFARPSWAAFRVIPALGPD